MRILLLEDEPKVSALVKRGLTAERYAVDVTEDGREGLEYAEAYPYDLILLDLMLPSLSGAEVLQRVRRTNQFVPILVLTARDSVDDKVKLFELGADDYLTKPFAFAELLVRVKALLRRGPVNRSSTLRVGDLELDRLTQQVTYALEFTLKDPTGLWLVSAHEGGATEYALTAWQQQRSAIRLDRIFRAGPEPLAPGSDHLWIVDYKTTTHGPEGL